mgnify:CR=1 FL=1
MVTFKAVGLTVILGLVAWAGALVLRRARRGSTSPDPRRAPFPPEDAAGLAAACLWWINWLYCRLMYRLVVVDPCPLPQSGPALLICNHTCGIDHLLLQAACRRVLGFLVAHEFAEPWWARPFIRMIGAIPVRRDGSDLTAAREALRALERGRVVPIFPEGRILPLSGRELLEARPGAAFLALKAGVPVIPAYLRGTPPTNNVPLAFVTPSRAELRFGPPILPDQLREGLDPNRREREHFEEVARRLMAAIDDLRRQAWGDALELGDPSSETCCDSERPVQN